MKRTKVNLKKDLPTPIIGKRKRKGWSPSRGVDVVYEDKVTDPDL